MSPQSGFILLTEIVPRLRSSIGSVRAMPGEDQEELLQDGTAIAAQILHSAEARGQKVSPGNVAFYATKYLKIGRRSTGYWRTDPLHPAAQACGHSRVHSMEEPLTYTESNDEPMVLADALASNHDDPGVEAARRLDWSELEEILDKVTRAILQAMITGQELTTLVKRLGKCRSSLQSGKDRLAEVIREKLGPDILAAVQERAAWRSGIDAGRERMACRWERMA